MNPTNLRTLITQATAPFQHLIHDLDEELNFADRLAELHPAEAAAWRQLCQQGRTQIAAVLSSGRLDTVPATVAAVEELLAPIAKVAKSYTIHCVGHAHIDMNWMWSWPETVAVTVDTFATVLRLMEEYPGFHVLPEPGQHLRDPRAVSPGMLKQIRRAREGGPLGSHRQPLGRERQEHGRGESCAGTCSTRAGTWETFGLSPRTCRSTGRRTRSGTRRRCRPICRAAAVKYLYLHRPGVHTASKPRRVLVAGAGRLARAGPQRHGTRLQRPDQARLGARIRQVRRSSPARA